MSALQSPATRLMVRPALAVLMIAGPIGGAAAAGPTAPYLAPVRPIRTAAIPAAVQPVPSPATASPDADGIESAATGMTDDDHPIRRSCIRRKLSRSR